MIGGGGLAARMAVRPARFWSWVAGAAVLALAVRLAFGFLYWTDKPLTQDEREYLQLGRNLADGQGFVYDPEPASPSGHRSFSRAPAYPFFLAGVFLLADGVRSSARTDTAGDQSMRDDPVPAAVPNAVKAAQSLVGAIGVVLLSLVARRTAGAVAGVIAACAAAVYPPFVWLPAYAFSETVFIALALGAVLLLQPALDERRDRPLWPVFAAGLLAGAATLTRPAMLVFLGLAALWLIARRRVLVAAALAAGALLVVAPWTARNYAVHGRLVLVAAEGGVTFWTGNHPLATGEGDMAANPAIKRAFRDVESRYAGLGNEEIEGVYYREALTYILGHPGRWSWLMVKKAFYTVVPIGPSYRLHSMRYYLLSLVSYLLVLPVAVAGCTRLRRAGRPTAALALYVASAVVVSLMFFPQERFRIPAVDPVLVVWASAWAAVKLGASGDRALGPIVEEAAR